MRIEVRKFFKMMLIMDRSTRESRDCIHKKNLARLAEDKTQAEVKVAIVTGFKRVGLHLCSQNHLLWNN